MSMFQLPVHVDNKLNAIRSNFLWEGQADNKSLLFKWLWKYNDGNDKTWKNLINAKYVDT